jgi:hypothetical protein
LSSISQQKKRRKNTKKRQAQVNNHITKNTRARGDTPEFFLRLRIEDFYDSGISSQIAVRGRWIARHF